MHLSKDRFAAAALVALLLLTGAFAQTRKKRAVVKKPIASATPTPGIDTTVSNPLPPPPDPPKRNERPGGSSPSPSKEIKPASPATNQYHYEFSQPEFVVSKILIDHDETGKGTIRFQRRGGEDMISDPITVSAAALERINNAYAALNFLDSSESYQYEKDYSHLGNTTFAFRKGEKERTATFNYTQNKDAKVLADEYRKIGNQFIWIFDITVARENQPLEAPKQLDLLDSLIRRNEISDPEQLIDFLRGLSDDERIPLIARNHSAKLIKQIEKGKKKK